MTQRRTVFFVSDGTGITAQMLGHSLLTQFEGVEFNQVTLPFVDSTEKAEECLARISAESDNGQPIVFSTLVNNDVRAVVRRANALFIDFFESFIDPLEAGLGIKSSHTIGRSHSAMDKKEYQQRIEAINFAMAHDDGASHRELG
ncbi:MAG TPA: kinase/pyrophosphorylase, partial [Burkholderiales bacterium]|nr:kinase/pyrophosphorylase [Burkholderiales bacterium]